MMDSTLVQDIIDYENGDMDFDRIVDMFQKLIDSGQAWTLQGHYGRTAMALIEQGHCTNQKTYWEKKADDPALAIALDRWQDKNKK
jgi:hypothetical protein